MIPTGLVCPALLPYLLDLADGPCTDTGTHSVLQVGGLRRCGRHRVHARRRPALRGTAASRREGGGRRRRGLLAGSSRRAGLGPNSAAGGGCVTGGAGAVDHGDGHHPLCAVGLVGSLGRLDDEEAVRGDGALDGLWQHVLGQRALACELARDDTKLVGTVTVLAVNDHLVVDGLDLEVVAVEVAHVQSEAEALRVVGQRCPDRRLERTAVEEPPPHVMVPVLVAAVLAVQPRVLVVQPAPQVVQLVRQPAAREQRRHPGLTRVAPGLLSVPYFGLPNPMRRALDVQSSRRKFGSRQLKHSSLKQRTLFRGDEAKFFGDGACSR